jgi:uncharacterized protein
MTWESRLEVSGGQLVSHAVKFSRELREAGVLVTPSQTALFAQALAEISVVNPGAFKDSARACLVCRREDIQKFEIVFIKFWRDLGMGGIPDGLLNQMKLPQPKKNPARPAEVREPGSSNESKPDGPPQELLDRSLTFSTDEVLKTKRFDLMRPAELEAARKLLTRFSWQVGERRTRRLQAAARGKQLDWRRSMRQAFKHDGEWLRLEWRDRKTKPRPLIVLADVSGSMERYSRMLLHFMHTVTQASRRGQRRKVEVFAFGTRMTRITKNLERKDVDAALDQVGKDVRDWSGGTRIGESFTNFNRQWAKRVLGRGSVVMVISDGWDQGDPAQLGKAMERLQKTCHRLIWLNPLIGTQGFQPQTRGLLAALPFVDDFLPVHNLRSLEQLAKHLEALPSQRSARRAGFRG